MGELARSVFSYGTKGARVEAENENGVQDIIDSPPPFPSAGEKFSTRIVQASVITLA